MFQPPLPPAKARVISDLGFGCVDKLFISFPDATTPLPSPADSGSALRHDHKELIRSYQLLWPQQDPSALGPISSQPALESQNSRASGCTCSAGHSSNGTTDASADHAGIAPSAGASHTSGTSRDGRGDKAGSGRKPLRELSHQMSHQISQQQAAAGQVVAQQSKHSSTGRANSQELAGQCPACKAESRQDAEVEEAWYTNLHSIRFGGSEFVNSARWFMAGQAGIQQQQQQQQHTS